jgi:hypothetical protein
MVIAIIAALVFSSDLKLFFRISMLFVMGMALAVLWPSVVEYVGYDSKVGNVGEYLGRRQEYGFAGFGGDVDIANMSWPMRLFTYLFRPLFLDAKNLFQLLSSFENMLLLFLFVKYSREFVRICISSNYVLLRFSVFYSTLMWVIMANTTPNLGTACRQKTMFLPALFILLSYAAGWIIYDDKAMPIPEENV